MISTQPQIDPEEYRELPDYGDFEECPDCGQWSVPMKKTEIDHTVHRIITRCTCECGAEWEES